MCRRVRCEATACIGRVLEAASKGELKTVVGGTFGFEDVKRVHEDLAARRTIGKILLDPSL